MNQNAELLNWLETAVKNIEEAELAALNALAQGDKAGYGREMRRKAEILVGLEEAAAPYLAGVSKTLAKLVKGRLASFSANASEALRLNSTFYMSALLYPEDHRAGDPNNLELLAAEAARSED